MRRRKNDFPKHASLSPYLSGKMFFLMFGRHPTRVRDRAFIQSHLYDTHKFPVELTLELRKRGLTPAHIHALFSTGFLLSDKTSKSAPLYQLKQWQAAIREYDSNPERYRKSPHGRILTSNLGIAASELYFLVSATVCHLGSFIESATISNKLQLDRLLILFLAARSLQVNRTLFRLMNSDEVSELLSLGRVLYETYARVLFFNNNPGLAIGLITPGLLGSGLFSYATNIKGKIDRNTTIFTPSGERIRCGFSLREMVDSSDDPRDGRFTTYFTLFYANSCILMQPFWTSSWVVFTEPYGFTGRTTTYFSS